MKLRRLRDGDVLEDGDAPSIYGVYGISVFAVRDATIDELAQQTPLVASIARAC